MAMATLAFWWTLRVALIAVALLYSGLVLTRYATGGARSPLRLDLGQPTRSAEQALVWGGVKLLDGMLRALGVVWDVCTEASAEVGEWFVGKRNPNA